MYDSLLLSIAAGCTIRELHMEILEWKDIMQRNKAYRPWVHDKVFSDLLNTTSVSGLKYKVEKLNADVQHGTRSKGKNSSY